MVMKKFRGMIRQAACLLLVVAMLCTPALLSGCKDKQTEETKKSSRTKAAAEEESDEGENDEDSNGGSDDDDDASGNGSGSGTTDGTETETEPEEEEEEDPWAEPEEELSEEETRDLALEIAGKVGLSEEDLHGQYALFLRYAGSVSSNAELHEFNCYLYRIFPIIADHIKPENEDYFLKKVRELEFHIIETEDFWGGFSPWSNTIEIGINQFKDSTPGVQATGLYHELMHFVDSFIDGPTTTIVLMDDGSFADSSAFDEEELWDMSLLDASYWSEGGSEKYYAQYFSHAPETGAYEVAEQFLVGLEYIFGSELVDDIFFSHDTDAKFIALLEENGFSHEEIIKLYHVMDKMLDREKIDPDSAAEEFLDPQETLIRLYINNIGPDFESDAIFCRILATMEDDVLKNIPSEYRDFTNTLHRFSPDKEQELLRQIRKENGFSSEGMNFTLPPSPLLVDGEYKLVGNFFIHEDGVLLTRTTVMDYDFETNELISFEVYDDFIPEKLFERLPSDDSPEAQELVEGLLCDNSAAHSQTVKITKGPLKDLYQRAVDIGNQYGVYIWFGGMTPDGVLFAEDTKAVDHTSVSAALDSIEAVLAQYPEGYFDQLTFNTYSGIAICLYDGNFEYGFPSTAFVRNTNYLMLYVNTYRETYIGDPVDANNIMSESFDSIDYYAAQLICDIWRMSEKVMTARNSFFDRSTFTEDSWQALNPSGFEYLLSSLTDEIEAYAAEVDLQYFLCMEAISFADVDRAITYLYLMYSGMTGSFPIEMTPECLAKAEYLCSELRFYFGTDAWPETTTWEQAIR